MRFAVMWMYCILQAFFMACNNHPEEHLEEDNKLPAVDYYISGTDSGVQLQFSNYTLKHTDSFELTINNIKSAYKIVSEQVMVLKKDDLAPGKNMIQFIYKNGNQNDTVSKIYFNTLTIDYEILRTIPHNHHYFTQGLLFDETGNLIESTGLKGESKIIYYRQVPNGFKAQDSMINPPNEFGEGIALVQGELIQLLWQNMYLRLYNKSSRKALRNLQYKKEGWGICNDGQTIYTSDGSNTIHVIDVSGTDVQILRSIQIQDENGAVANLNELEFINGMIFANVWQADIICMIDPTTGFVVGKLDFSSLAAKENQQNPDVDVLNGIAYNPSKNTILITGKYWAHFYEISLKTK